MQRVCVFHRHLARVAVVWPIREKRSIIVFAGRKGEWVPSSKKGERNLLGHVNKERAWVDYRGRRRRRGAWPRCGTKSRSSSHSAIFDSSDSLAAGIRQLLKQPYEERGIEWRERENKEDEVAAGTEE